ncbi:MAG: family 43 glycosylhydrolase [Bacteroidota bacterium]|nr:family 43 glycosylhydrolase [Bacteroidota bacterium]
MKPLPCFSITAILFSVNLLCANFLHAQPKTYCNPLNIDYAYVNIPENVVQGKHRATADPVIVLFKNHYFLFSTNQYGYWWSDDMSKWNFVPRSFLLPYHHVYDDLCAPAAAVIGDTLLLLGSTYTLDFPLWMSTDPTHDNWKMAVDSFKVGAWDPDLFLDDDGRLYLYFGSSNVYPIYGQEIDRKTFQPIGERKELIRLHDDIHGWERFGEHNDNTFLRPFIEGSWMTKHDGKYYLQYGAPGTEQSGYADGVYVGNHPLGPFTYQTHNPFSYKPGGFCQGAGHGSTFQDKYGNWWHVSTIRISVKNNFERRIGLWRAGFDNDGVLYCNTSYGDYPHYLPNKEMKKDFTGWMLLNYNKPVTVSSTLGGYEPNYAVDENIRTYWSAATADSGEWLESDLGEVCTVRAIQINYADQNAELMGKQLHIFHRYLIYQSADGKKWNLLVDKGKNTTDVPHDYVELNRPVETRYLKIVNVHVPTGKFALSGFRVFGNAHKKVANEVKNFIVLRGESERRNAWIKWAQSDDAVGYTIYFGSASDKLYNSIQVYGANEYFFAGMTKDIPYYFQIEAFNESGIGKRTAVVKAE